jgi:hypothetical protein
MGETMAREVPVSALSSVDLPTLGRPMMATEVSCCSNSPWVRWRGSLFLRLGRSLWRDQGRGQREISASSALRSVLLRRLWRLRGLFFFGRHSLGGAGIASEMASSTGPRWPPADNPTRALPTLHEFFRAGRHSGALLAAL